MPPVNPGVSRRPSIDCPGSVAIDKQHSPGWIFQFPPVIRRCRIWGGCQITVMNHLLIVGEGSDGMGIVGGYWIKWRYLRTPEDGSCTGWKSHIFIVIGGVILPGAIKLHQVIAPADYGAAIM